MDFTPSNSSAMNPPTELRKRVEECVTVAWLHLVAQTVDTYSGDDWLALCPDISEGELYRDWFIWYDGDVAEEWEAYDPETNRRHTHTDLNALKAQIDQLEAQRKKNLTAA
ncbi:MAG: hypothetical protein ACFBSC_19215 [Microcoleaceae cyanobacterium]